MLHQMPLDTPPLPRLTFTCVVRLLTLAILHTPNWAPITHLSSPRLRDCYHRFVYVFTENNLKKLLVYTDLV
jgi:hypothetical protein